MFPFFSHIFKCPLHLWQESIEGTWELQASCMCGGGDCREEKEEEEMENGGIQDNI